MSAATLVRIACACAVCEVNSAKVGASFPMLADVPPALASRKKSHHALITDAHNTGAIGQAMRARTGIRPA